MKIQIIGFSGSGKSTLAKSLAIHYQIPVLYMDNVQFYDNWKERTKQRQTEITQEFLDHHDSWVIDGNYSDICPSRFKDSDMTIYLAYHRLYCLISAFKRYLKYKGTIRESCNSPEKFDKEFFWWILKDGRTKAKIKKQIDNFNQTSGQKLIFKSRRQLNKWLKENDIKIII